jgi:hypothetical protein
MQLNSITSPAVIEEATVKSAVVVEAEVPTMMSRGCVMSDAEQCQPFGAVAELPIVMTVEPEVTVAVVNFPAVAPPTRVVSSKPPLEVKVVPVDICAAALSVPVALPAVPLPMSTTPADAREIPVSAVQEAVLAHRPREITWT